MQPIPRVDAEPEIIVVECREPLKDGDPSLAVTNHAVTRYMQRILHVTLDGPFPNKRDEARAHCHAAGLSIKHVRALIWTPGLALAVRMGLPSVDNGQFAAIIDPVSGAVKTILQPRSKHQGRLKLLSEREFQKRGQRAAKRQKRKPAPAIRVRIDEEGFENA